MPCRAITFGHAPQAAQRRLSQSVTMASRTLSTGRFEGWDSNAVSARLTPFRQDFVACLSTTTRNKPLTQHKRGSSTVDDFGPRGGRFTDRVTQSKHEQPSFASRLCGESCRGVMWRIVAAQMGYAHLGGRAS